MSLSLFESLVIAGVLAATVVTGVVVYKYDRAITRAEDAEARAEQFELASRAWELESLQSQLDLATCQQQFADAKASFDQMLVEATAGRERARAQLAAWRAKWDARSMECRDVVMLLDTHCSSAEGY